MAREIIEGFGAYKIIMTRGTPSHVGKEEDWEDTIAEAVGADIRSEQFIDVEGYKIYARHKVGRSSIAHGRNTAPNRLQSWNFIKSASGLCPLADWVILNHVHYCIGGFQFFGNKKIETITIPALQTVSQYGVKECEGEVHFGLVYADIHKGVKKNQKELIEIIKSAQPQEIVI